MLQESPTQNLRESRAVVLDTGRLVLRQPTLADVKAIAGIVGDRSVAINLRREPHPYSQDDAIHFVSSVANAGGMTTFLIEQKNETVGLASLTWERKMTHRNSANCLGGRPLGQRLRDGRGAGH